MSGNGTQHPARSVDFLSRLHDGELDVAERARFEAHRTHCAECRRAAVEFEDAISLFRSSRSTPPRSDLAARILRKVQSTNRPRSPFPRRFRIELTWAALLVTALLALLISTPITLRQSSPPVPVTLGRTTSTPAPAAAPPVFSRKTELEDTGAARRPVAARPEAEPLLQKREAKVNPVAGDASSPEKRKELRATAESAARPAEADERSDRFRDGERSRDKLSRVVVPAESPARAAGGAEEDAAAAPTAPLKLTVRSIDGYGAAPPILSGEPLALPREERGREYVLLLDSQGAVREVRPTPAPEALSRLHFRAGSRPRRVLVRIE
jgi:hypothetical protein